MALVPTFQPILPQWRGDTSSADMNTNFNQILYDLNTLFTECSALVLDINTLNNTVSNEKFLKDLQDVIGQLDATSYKKDFEKISADIQLLIPGIWPLLSLQNRHTQIHRSVLFHFGLLVLQTLIS